MTKKYGTSVLFVGQKRGVLNGDTKTKLVGKISEPSIVLGDECVMSMNVDNALFGRVKVFASLANLKMALGNEGFSDIVIKYMGEQWVMLEFKSLESMEKFKKCVSVMSWFSQVIKATNEFEVDGRIAWVEVEGVPFKLWTNNTFTRIAEKWGKLLDVDDQDETCFHSKRLCVYLKAGNSIREDFKITHRVKMITPLDEEGEVKKNGISDEHMMCWGNSVFDYVYSEAVGNSGGKWRLTGKNMMIIGVYAPQEGKEKQALWDFLRFEVDKWNGDVIIMGDFNEVRVKSDRFGTHFNPHGAHRFNSFILDSGLVEVNLGGCRFIGVIDPQQR
ncbi:nucleotide-binding alpha-beta plait domain-containing protein [Tanacetum coccineum]